MVDHGLRHEHHRGLGDRPRRLARVRHLEERRGASAPRRATLHDRDLRRGEPMTPTKANPETEPTTPALHMTRWTVTSSSNAQSRGAVVIEAGSHHWRASAEGNGAVDALFKAVDAALADVLQGHP